MDRIAYLKDKKTQIENDIAEIDFKIRNDDNNKMKWVKTRRLFQLELKKNKKEIELETIKKEIIIFKNTMKN